MPSLPIKPVRLPVSAGPLSNGKLTPCQMKGLWCHGWGFLQVHPQAHRAFDSLFIVCKAETGVQLTAVSPGDAYRSYEAQVRVFLQRYTDIYDAARNTMADGRTWQGKRWYKLKGVAAVATPGTSNHGFGLALDVAIWNAEQQAVQGITSNAWLWAWLQQNADSFGLCWEMQSEPWHLRLYVGDDTAQRVIDVENFLANAA